MLRKVKSMFVGKKASPPKDVLEAKRMALAVLLVEVTRMDTKLLACERRMAQQALKVHFALSDEDAEQLIMAAEREGKKTLDYQRYTEQINRGFTPKEKVEILTSLWRVAYADGELDKHEEYFIRKVAQLTGVSHRDFIAAKLRAASDRNQSA